MKLKIKTLLLGSVAATFVAAGAQAADLTVAEPVDYVKVCDLFGAGFFYSPGTDTCIKVGGYVKFGTAFGGTQFGTYNSYYPNSNWNNFYTDTEIQVTASSVTEYGNLTGYVGFEATTSSTGSFTQSASQFINSETNSAYIDQAYLQLGALKAGRFTSLYDFGRGYTDTGFFGSDTTSDHIQATYAINGFGLALSIEDQRDRGAAPGLDTYDPSSGVYAYGGQTNIPDVVGAVTYASGIFSSKIAAAYVNDAVDRSGGGTILDPYNYQAQTGWAIGGSIELALDQVSAGDKFFFTASYGDNANAYTGIAGGTSVAALSSYTTNAIAAASSGTSWSTGASYKHVWMPQLYTALSAGYAEYTGNGDWHGEDGLKAWRVVLGTDWTPVKNLDLLLEGAYNKIDGEGSIASGDAWTTVMWIKRSFP